MAKQFHVNTLLLSGQAVNAVGNNLYVNGQLVQGSSATGIDFVTNGSPLWKEGRVFYDSSSHSLAYYNNSSGITINLGQEQMIYVHNGEGVPLSNGSVVRVAGAAGQTPIVMLADARDSAEVFEATMGIMTEPVEVGNNGYMTTFGVVHDIDLHGAVEGDTVYLTSGGLFSNLPLPKPNYPQRVGYVTYSSNGSGHVLLHIHSTTDIDWLADVLSTNLAEGDLLVYTATSGLWVNRAMETGTIVRNAQTGAFASVVNLNTTGQMLSGQTSQLAASGSAISGNLKSTGAFLQSEIIIISGTTGAFVTTGSLKGLNTGSFITSGQLVGLNTGSFITAGQTGQFYASNNPAGYITSAQVSGTGVSYIGGLTANVGITGQGNVTVYTGTPNLIYISGATGAFASVTNLNATGAFLQSEIVIISGTTGAFALGVNLQTTGAFLQSEIVIISGTTGAFLTTSQTGKFADSGWVDQYYYPRTNPSGFGAGGPGGGGVSTLSDGVTVISGAVILTGYGSVYTDISGQYIIISGAASTGGGPPIDTGNFVDRTSDQLIGGNKIFTGEITFSGGDLHIWTTGSDYAIRATGNTNSFYELAMMNLVTGVDSSADFRAGFANTPWDNLTDMGINSPYYTGFTVGYTGDGYVYHEGNDFYVGNVTVGRKTLLFAGHGLSGTTAQQASGIELTITSGHVGILSGTPQFELDVAGTGNFQKGLRVSGRSVLMAPMEKGKAATWTNPDGIPTGTYYSAVWRCNTPAQLTGIYAYRIGGSGVFVNAFKNNPSTPHFPTNLSIATSGAWYSSGTNISLSGYSEGDTLILGITSVSGLPTSVTVQAEMVA